ncbi:MAG: fibronectin type III domain-containing protein, partial [Gammaproteobacteria bacterium]
PLAIAELRGYEIYVISESTGERTVITIDDPLREEHRLDGLPPDTWHFAVAAIDTAGNPSELSAVVSKTIADTSVASNP